jgi:lactate permease
MGSVQFLVVTAGFWNLGAFIAGVVGLIVAFPMAARFRGPQGDNGELDLRGLIIALSGYVALVAIILAVQLIRPLGVFLDQVVIQVEFPQTVTRLGYVTPAGIGRRLSVFRHTGVVFLYACIVAFLIYKAAGLYKPGALGRIVNGTLQRVMSSSVSIASMVAMAVVMEYAGMTDTLARSLAETIGVLYPIIAPWIGAIGAFMTGSNTNSNVVFGGLQMQTAMLLGLNVAIILAAQTAGAALASVMAPTKVVVGASTAGMAGREGDVMRKLIVYTLILLVIISLLAMVGVWVIA